MKGNKKFLTVTECTFPQVKQYKELSAAWCLEQTTKDEVLKTYVPDQWYDPGASICRTYLIKVISSIAPDFLNQVVTHANAQRQVKLDDDGQQLNLDVCEETKRLIANVPYVPSK